MSYNIDLIFFSVNTILKDILLVNDRGFEDNIWSNTWNKTSQDTFQKKTNEKIDYLSEKFNQLIIPENS